MGDVIGTGVGVGVVGCCVFENRRSDKNKEDGGVPRKAEGGGRRLQKQHMPRGGVFTTPYPKHSFIMIEQLRIFVVDRVARKWMGGAWQLL